MKKLFSVLAIILTAYILYLLFWPAPIDPISYTPPEAPEMTGPFAPNNLLHQADHLASGQLRGPEDIAVDDQGRIYTGTEKGLIVRVDDGHVQKIAETKGRPLGLEFDPQGNLIVADALQGLLKVDPQGNITELCTEVDGQPLGFTNHLDVAEDGTIYFTDASQKFSLPEYILDLMEARPHGRLLRYDPDNGQASTLLEDLYFANGVALSADQDFLLVNETFRYRVNRYWLQGEKAGTSEVIADNLPGFPDNISSTADNRFWLALYTNRNELVDAIQPYPFLKQMMSKLPEFLWPEPEPYGFIVQLDEEGRIQRTLQDIEGQNVCGLTSAQEADGKLYMGTLYNDYIGVLSLHELEDTAD